MIEEPEVRKIRFGVMLNGSTCRLWQSEVIKHLLRVPNVELVLLVVNKETLKRSAFSELKRYWQTFRWNHLLWYAYNALWVLHRIPELKTIPFPWFYSNIKTIQCQVEKRGKYSEYFTESDIEKIKEQNLDFMLRFGFNIIRGEVLKAASLGVWSFHHDDETRFRGGPPGFWEVYHNESISAAILQRLTDRLDGGIVLKKGYLKTDKTSYTANLAQLLRESVTWPAQVCIDLNNRVSGYVSNEPSLSTAPIYFAPGTIHFLFYWMKVVYRFVGKAIQELLFLDYWSIGFVREPIQLFVEKKPYTPSITWLSLFDYKTFAADPFGYYEGNSPCVLFEKLDYQTTRGEVYRVALDAGKERRATPEIVEPWHLSYPYTFTWDGGLYCVPESADANQVVLYQLSQDKRWIKKEVLLNIPLVDSTVFEYQDRWWLFGTDRHHGSSYRLLAWYAQSPLGPWQEHTNNPIKLDIRSSRPAGTPFVSCNTLFRPSQDYSRDSQGGVVINRVIRLSPTEFEEENFVSFDTFHDSESKHGTHTLSSLGGWTVVDGKTKRFVFWHWEWVLFMFSSLRNYYARRKRLHE